MSRAQIFFKKEKKIFRFGFLPARLWRAKAKRRKAELRFVNIKKVNLLAPDPPVRANSNHFMLPFDFSYCIEEKAISQLVMAFSANVYNPTEFLLFLL